MKLVGMLDSPYVRRVAIALDQLDVPFEHEAVSVFSSFDEFQEINPVVKAPTMVCDDGGLLMDSALILQCVEAERFPDGSPLWSRDSGRRLQQFRTVVYASAAIDKAVQFVYEKQLRPLSAQHVPWLARVRGQFTAAFAALEALTPDSEQSPQSNGHLDHASIWSAIVWQCAQALIADELPAARHPQLVRLSREFEALPLFQRWPPDGPGVPGSAE